MNYKKVSNSTFWARLTRNQLAAKFSIATFLVVFYSGALTKTYGFLDDYVFLNNGFSGGTFRLILGAGRPLSGFIVQSAFAQIANVENLALIRGAGLLGLIFASFFLETKLRPIFISRWTSIAAATAFACLPAFLLYVSWAQYFLVPYGLIMVMLSHKILVNSLKMRPYAQVRRLILAITLLTSACMIYQPVGMAIFSLFLIDLWGDKTISKGSLGKYLTLSSIVVVIALGVAYIALRVGVILGTVGSARSLLASSLGNKFFWFISELLPNALALYSVPRSGPIVICAAVVIVVGVALRIRRISRRQRIISISIYLVLAIFSAIPNLATAENWASYRSNFGLSTFVFMSIVLALNEIFKTFSAISFPKPRFTKKIYRTIVAGVFTVAIINAGIVMNIAIQDDNRHEYSSMLEQLKDKRIKGTLHYVISSWTDSHTRPLSYDEFGMPSSVSQTNAEAMLRLGLAHLHKSLNLRLVPQEPMSQDLNSINKSYVLDFRTVVSQR